MNWLTVTEYLCHKWPRKCSIWRIHHPEISSFVTYHRFCNKSSTTGATFGAGTAYPSGVPEFIPCFCGVRVARSLVFCVMFCRSLFVLLTFFFWPLYCMSFFDLQYLITPLVTPNISFCRLLSLSFMCIEVWKELYILLWIIILTKTKM
jgi:hypothetical protein